MIYTVRALRCGHKHGHSYMVGVSFDKELAEEIAEKHEALSNYKCEIIGWDETGMTYLHQPWSENEKV